MSEIKKLIEKIELFVPGLKGYKEKELLREEDLAVRRKIEEMLNDSASDIRLAEQTLIMGGLDPTIFEERVVQQLEVLRAWVSSAECGFGGLLDKINIEEPQLKKILENDCKMLELVSEIRKKAKDIAFSDPQKILESTSEFIGKMMEVKSLLENRKKILLGE